MREWSDSNQVLQYQRCSTTRRNFTICLFIDYSLMFVRLSMFYWNAGVILCVHWHGISIFGPGAKLSSKQTIRADGQNAQRGVNFYFFRKKGRGGAFFFKFRIGGPRGGWKKGSWILVRRTSISVRMSMDAPDGRTAKQSALYGS